MIEPSPKEVRVYTQGRCMYLAEALSKTFKLNQTVIYGWNAGFYVPVHVVCKIGKGFLDVEGFNCEDFFRKKYDFRDFMLKDVKHGWKEFYDNNYIELDKELKLVHTYYSYFEEVVKQNDNLRIRKRKVIRN